MPEQIQKTLIEKPWHMQVQAESGPRVPIFPNLILVVF
jgi:hypothetical protein